MQNIGIGTAGIQKDLEKLFHHKTILRVDRDQISGRKDLEDFIKQVAERKADILVGTQMIAKGLDFKYLTLVGVVSADTSLNLPDFRASERTFQLLVQMAGRAGRHGHQGEVLIQTFNQHNPVIQEAINYQYSDFAQRELSIRKALSYPPFQRTVLIRAQGYDSQKVESALKVLADFAKQQAGSLKKYFEVLGPAPAPLSKLRGQYRYQILIKGSKGLWLSQFCQHLKAHLQFCLETSSNKAVVVSSLTTKPKKKQVRGQTKDSATKKGQQISFEFTDLTQEHQKTKKAISKSKASKIQVDFDIDPLQML